MDIRRGSAPAPVKLMDPLPARRDMGHNVYMAWECFISMVGIRSEAIPLWQRVTKLARMIDKHPDHPSNGEAGRRIDTSLKEFRELQLQFVRIEVWADQYWRMIPRKERIEECVHDMFGVEPDATTILGAGHRQLGESEGAPIGCKIDATVIQFSPPAMERAYQRAIGS
jgi:hypothetical protein